MNDLNTTATYSPVSLSYVAALRGVKPRRPGQAFTYAEIDCHHPDLLVCLAASNPEGTFYGVMADGESCARATSDAALRGVTNVSFVQGTAADILARVEKGDKVLPPLHYLVCDESENTLHAGERNALFGLAEKLVIVSGLFHYSYRAYDKEDGALRFLVNEMSPEMSATQASEFLLEVKKLGTTYLKGQPSVMAKLNDAIAKNMPDAFFDSYETAGARSATFDTIVAMRSRNLAYAGDAHVAANYIELSVPAAAQQIVLECRTNPLYEPVKDFALNRSVRSDIWCRMPATQTKNNEELFGGFSYGITRPRDAVPSEIEAHGKTIPLDSTLYRKLIDLMAMMPVSVGDFLSHADGKAFGASDVVGAIQILVACGIARPMRGLSTAHSSANITQPRLVGAFNRYLDKTPVTGGEMRVASSVLGDAMVLSARDALVMQAVYRAGLANSVDALLPELKRLAQNPVQAARIMDVAEPTSEVAHHMIEEVLSKSMVQWYAYGILEAA
jgi:hypothetical protein